MPRFAGGEVLLQRGHQTVEDAGPAGRGVLGDELPDLFVGGGILRRRSIVE
jgi:hypothetical protein